MKVIRRLRTFLGCSLGRALTAAIITTSLYTFIDPSTYVYALEQQRTKDAEVRAIAAKLGVDPEFLLHPEGRRHFDWTSVMSWVGNTLGITALSTAPAAPLDPREAVARVKSRYALVAADTVIAKIAGLVKLAAASDRARGKAKGRLGGELQSIARLIDKNLLPNLPEGLPGVAGSRDHDMRQTLDRLRQAVKGVTNNPNAMSEANAGDTLQQLSRAVGGMLTLRDIKPRWTRDPFPAKDTYRTMPRRSAPSTYGANAVGSTALVTSPSSANRLVTSSAKVPLATAVPSDVATVAQTLGTPAHIFTFVHDRIQWEAYGGVAKGSLGTLKEMSGNDWDQALLLRDLLAAKGYQAQIEWGKVTVPMAMAMNLAGTEDPLQAANLLATAGFDGQLLMNGSTPVAVQMTHAWVQAFIPYFPNRGATAGTADTWVRMDPSFKHYNYQPGIATNAVWNEDGYLGQAGLQAPIDYYSDQVWSYIRGNNLTCSNLSQVPKSGTIRAGNYPFVPSTLTVGIDQTLGLAADPPADQIQRVTLTLGANGNGTIATYAANLSDLYGKKLTITFPPATPDDAAIINSYGGIFNTPAYLVRLKPVVSIDDAVVAEGSAVAAGATLDLGVGFHSPNIADDATHHDVIAGETHSVVLDAGAVSDALLTARAQRLQTLTDPDAILSEKLFLIGLRYMQHIDDGLRLAAGLRWHRSVKRAFEADVRRQIDVTYNVAGAPLRLVPAENNIDVARLLVGVVPIGSDVTHRAEVFSLAGMESSWREGAIWEEMESQQGISAAKALLLARMSGQTLLTADAANVDAVLATANLSSDVENEIRGAIAQGRIAKLAPNPVSLGHWSGTGYILEDPVTGAATYPISGGLAGGSDTGDATQGIQELLGSESWLSGSPLGDLLREVLSLMGGGGGSPPSTTQGDPVNLSSGNVYRSATDLSVIARGIPVTLSRTYNSRSTVNGAFGFGWTFNYGESLTENGDGSVIYREADGTEHRFVNQSGVYVAPPGKHLTLTRNGGGWLMRFKDGTQFAFDNRGLLVSQADLNGNVVTVNRDPAGNLTTVVDASGRTVLTFGYAAGKIAQVTDPAGRIVHYTYTGDDLTTVVDTAGKSWTFGYDIAHNMVALADPLGNTQRFDYDADDRLMHHVDATGAEEFFHYDIAARQAVITDRRGGDRLVVFDDLGRATLESDPAGNVVKASFDVDNNRTATIDSRNKTTTYEFDPTGNVTKQTNPDGGVMTTTYDANARPLVSTDPLGVVTTNSYDANGNLRTSSRSVNGVTETTTNSYDGHGQLLSTTDPMGGVSSMTWNDNGSLATRTDAATNTTTMTSDALGRISAISDAAGNTTSLTYDGKDRIATMIDPYTNTTTFAYDDAGRRISVTNPRGTTTYTYDAEGRMTSVKDPLSNTSRTSYSAAGDVFTRTDARGNVTAYEYDLAGRVTKMTDAAGGVWTYAYCAGTGGGRGGSFCNLVDPNGNTIHQEFDDMGRVSSITDSLGHSSFMQYDKAGRKTLDTDANGNATGFHYDDAGRLLRVIEASGAETAYTYDRNGNKITQKDANGNTWSYTYDALNRLVQERDPLGRTNSMTYDAIGNLKTRTDGKGQTTTYAYTVRRLSTVTYADGATESFTYDPLGRRIGMSNASVSMAYIYDTLNRITKVTNQTYNHVVNYVYDAAGNISSRSIVADGLAPTFQSRTLTTQYAYDPKNRLTTIADPLAGTFRFGYDPMDRRTSLAYPNGTSTFYEYDKGYRLTALATKGSTGSVIDAWSYQYDAVGNRISKTDMDGKVEGYSYDNTYRLTEARYGDGSRETFTYDPVGNRRTRTDESGTTITYSYDIANQMLTSGAATFTYDANGNMTAKTTSSGTTTMAYDAANRVSAISGASGREVNAWAPDGRRTQMTGDTFIFESGQSGGTSIPIHPIYDLAGNPIADGGSGTSILRYRVYGPGIDEPLAEANFVGNISYLHHDALGSITCATNATSLLLYRNRYKAFGTMTYTGTTDINYQTRLSYTSRENSVGGVYQYRCRYYDSGVGRFAQKDTERGQSVSPPSLQRYLYCFNSPIVYVDPTGHMGFAVDTIAGIFLLAGTLTLLTELFMYAISGSDDIVDFSENFWSGVGRSLVFFAGLLWVLSEKLAHYSGVLEGLGALAVGLSIFGVALDVALFWRHIARIATSPNVSDTQRHAALFLGAAYTALGMLAISSIFWAPEVSMPLLIIVAILGEVLDYALEPMAQGAG